MDVSNTDSLNMTGSELLEMLVSLTGLPPELARAELDGILREAGCTAESCTMDDLRMALMGHLEKLGAEASPPAVVIPLSKAAR